MQSIHLQKLIRESVARVTRRGSRYDEDGEEDLSYDDALLDVEIRSFLRAEYGMQKPPDGIFARVMQSVRLHREGQTRVARVAGASGIERIFRQVGQALAGAYRYGARPDAGRMISGGLIAALLVLAVWPGLARSLANGQQMPLSIDVLLSGSDTAPAGNLAGAPALEDATSTSAIPEVSSPVPAAPSAPSTSAAPQTNYLSRGRLYDDPRMLLAQRTGEDPSQLKLHSSKQSPDSNGYSNSDGSHPSDTDPQYDRPVSGQF